MRQSRQRNAILHTVKGTKSHPTADWVYDSVRKEIPNVSLGTVYRNLGQLVDNNDLKAFNYNGMVHYDAHLSNHQHFYCLECSVIFDINLDEKDFISRINNTTTHIVTDFQLILTGLCKTCKKNNKRMKE
ncbi:MAG: transcriptional repressor [Candidatus Neomarinimicrobiota bacterium]